jgi:hypothetical protein
LTVSTLPALSATLVVSLITIGCFRMSAPKREMVSSHRRFVSSAKAGRNNLTKSAMISGKYYLVKQRFSPSSRSASTRLAGPESITATKSFNESAGRSLDPLGVHWPTTGKGGPTGCSGAVASAAMIGPKNSCIWSVPAKPRSDPSLGYVRIRFQRTASSGILWSDHWKNSPHL